LGVYVNDELERLDLARALDGVSPERREAALRFRFDRDRRQSVAVYLLLKEALEREYGLTGNPRLASAPGGKPYLPDHPAIHFSFSHCAKAAACAVSDRPVGIDVEAIAPVDPEVARRVLSADERTEMRASAEPDVVFARYWTRKEALVKLSGRGLEESLLPSLLTEMRDVVLETTVCREKGYVLSVAKAWRICYNCRHETP